MEARSEEVCSSTSSSSNAVDDETGTSSPNLIANEVPSTLMHSNVANKAGSLISRHDEGSNIRSSNIALETTTCRAGDIAQSPAFPPVQPKHVRFPVTIYSNRTRSFSPTWYHTYGWLEYSVELDACFCYPCRLFGSGGGSFSSRPEATFITTGFKDSKHATGKNGILVGHNNCISHKQAIVAWRQFQHHSKQGTSISEQLGNTRTDLFQKNCHYIKTIADYCAVSRK